MTTTNVNMCNQVQTQQQVKQTKEERGEVNDPQSKSLKPDEEIRSDRIDGREWSRKDLFDYQERVSLNRLVTSTMMDQRKLDNDILAKTASGISDSTNKMISASAMVAKGIRY